MINERVTTYDLMNEAREEGMHPISYSQTSMFNNCPWAWKLKYVDKIRENTGSIHIVFGSAMHTVVQAYVKKIYEVSGKAADEMDLNKMLLEEMKYEFVEHQKGISDPDTFATKADMVKFYNDGVEILAFLKKKRGVYFPKKGYELRGIEFPLKVKTDSHNGIAFIGFIDLIIADVKNNKLKIIDIKTSTRGWNKNKKSDFLAAAQLVLYKRYYAKQFNIDPKSIEIEFFILKRELYENCDFPQKRVQIFAPASGKPTLNKAEKLVNNITEAFDDNGKVKPDFNFIKMGGTACKWCDYKTHPDKVCPKNERMV